MQRYPGQTFGVKVHIANQSPSPVKLEHCGVEPSMAKESWSIMGEPGHASKEIANDQALEAKFTVKVPDDASFTRPYFSRPDIEQSYYDISDERFLNHPLAPYPLAAWADFEFVPGCADTHRANMCRRSNGSPGRAPYRSRWQWLRRSASRLRRVRDCATDGKILFEHRADSQ